jgi:hypothetical protein
MSLYTVDDVLKDIENEKILLETSAKNTSKRINDIQKTVIKELIVEATIPKYRQKMNDLSKLLNISASITAGAIINKMTKSNKGSESFYDYTLPEMASSYACKLVNLMNGSQAIYFLEDCLRLGVYNAIRSWDLEPDKTEAFAYQNIPTGYILHPKVKLVYAKRREPN